MNMTVGVSRPRGLRAAIRAAVRAAATAAALACAPASATADIFAIAVGVDAYDAAPDLGGAVADARDIAASVRALGGEAAVLTDAAATRQAVLTAFRDAARRARPGDVILFSFAGHGVQEPEAHPGEEADGRDETLLLGGFQPSGPRSAERLRDNEIAALFAEAAPGVRILFVVDACHSGTMTRALDPRGRSAAVRNAPAPRIVDDALPPPPRRAGGDAMDPALPGVVFVSAAAEHELVPEVRIDGRPRGALSWAVARALVGAAGEQADALALDAFVSFTRATVRSLAAGRQSPQFAHAAEDAARPLLPRGSIAPSARAALVAARAEAGPAPLPAVAAPGMTAAVAALRDALRPAASAADADLMWDAAAGEVVDMATADVLGLADTAGDVAGAARRWRAERMLAQFQPAIAHGFRIEPDAAVRRLGEQVWLAVDPPHADGAALLILVLSGDGRVQVVLPPSGPPSASPTVAAQGLRLGPAPITPPIGADIVLAILCACDLSALAETARRPRVDPVALVGALQRLARRSDLRVGRADLYVVR